MKSLDAVRSEIEALHAFFVEWFSGRARPDDADFDAVLTARFDPELVLIPPGGQVLAGAALLDAIRKAHGNNPEFRIAIRNVQIVRDFGLYRLVTYEEWQMNAKASTPPNNGRISTVLFEEDPACPGGLRWLHVHETWLPADQMAAGPYDF